MTFVLIQKISILNVLFKNPEIKCYFTLLSSSTVVNIIDQKCFSSRKSAYLNDFWRIMWHWMLHIFLFFAHLFCTSYCFLHILLFCTFFYFIAHFTLISPFLTICMPLCYVTLYNLYSYYFALSTERTWFDYISLLIIPCITIMWQIKKPWPWRL